FYSPNMLCLSSSGPDENSYSYHADLSIGINVVDRFTYWTSRFLSGSVKDTRSKRTVQDLVNTLPWSKLHSHATLRDDLYPSSASDTLLTEFLAATDQFIFVERFRNLTGAEEGRKAALYGTFRTAEKPVGRRSVARGEAVAAASPSKLVVTIPEPARALLCAMIVLLGAAASALFVAPL
ncbi:hypothetical protein FOZ63_011810, partial [Perkinsus olseni]